MEKLGRKTLERLINGELPWEQLRQIIAGDKDPYRFEQLLEILQERVPWEEQILLPLQECLYIVVKNGQRIVKCECGHEFGSYLENWKKKSRIRVRKTAAELEELYPQNMTSDPEWVQLREFFCPGCFTMLDVESVPPGYPVIFNFLPDIDAFYQKWLRQEPPDKK